MWGLSRDQEYHICMYVEYKLILDFLASNKDLIYWKLLALFSKIFISTGVGLHLTGIGPLPNNSIVIADSTRTIADLQCISASETPNIGRFVLPSGQDINETLRMPFDITVGGQNDPGHIIVSVAPGQTVRISDGGIYTCIILDEAGAEQIIHVGIYDNTFNSK